MKQLPLDMPFPKLQGYNDFIISDCNKLAAAWINRWPNWPKPGHCLNLVGPMGSGKSHLAAIWQGVTGARLCDHPSQLDQLMASHAVPVIVIDKIDNGFNWPNDLLFHLFNRCDDQAGGLLILSQQPIAQMRWDLPDLRSRMRGTAVASISLPDDRLIYKLLDKYFVDRQLAAPPNVLHYLAGRMERSFMAIQIIAGHIDRLSIAERRPLTVALARTALEEASNC